MLNVDCHEIRKVRAALTLTQCVLLHQRLGLCMCVCVCVCGGGSCVYFRFCVQYFVFKFLHCAVLMSVQGLRVAGACSYNMHRA